MARVSAGSAPRTTAVLSRAALPAALLVALLGAGATGSAAQEATGPAPTRGATAADLPRLQAELAGATAQARDLAAALDAAAAQAGGLRRQVEELAEAQDAARARFDDRVREVYIAQARGGASLPGLPRDPHERVLDRRGATRAVVVERALVDAVSGESEAARALAERSAAYRSGLRAQAEQALAAQERARVLLAQAEQVAAVAAAAEERARRVAAREALDRASASVTQALAPAVTDRGRRAQRDEASVLAAVEAAGAGYPAGWAPTGTVLRGEASWYGPGFVGSPTASGAPYDPERLTCAHKTLPLGTVVHVVRGTRAVNCLVNDRGPYVGDRIIDLSRAGSRALGYDGVAQVVVEVLAPTG